MNTIGKVLLGAFATLLLIGSSIVSATAVVVPAKKVNNKTRTVQTVTTPSGSTGETIFGMSANGNEATKQAEQKLGLQAAIYGIYAPYTASFPTQEVTNAVNRGAVTMISWEPKDWNNASVNQTKYSLKNINAGKFDTYMKNWLTAAKKTNQPIYVRWAAEMNGDWHPWSTGINGNKPGEYRAAHRRVVNLAKGIKASNIKFVFNPIVSYEGSYPLKDLYPGDAYVDEVALDGFNWGSTRPWGWQSFEDIFTLGLKELNSVTTSKPIGIAEIGCAPGVDKAKWIKETLTAAKNNNIKWVVWFEHLKETDWRLTQNDDTVKATQETLNDLSWIKGGDLTVTKTALNLIQ